MASYKPMILDQRHKRTDAVERLLSMHDGGRRTAQFPFANTQTKHNWTVLLTKCIQVLQTQALVHF